MKKSELINIIKESIGNTKRKILFEQGGKIVHLYQSTTPDKLKIMLNSDISFSAEFFGSAGGNMHTRAVYSNPDIRQAMKLNYGNVLVELDLYGGFDNFICINKGMSYKYFGGKDIITQIKQFPELYSLLSSSHEGNNILSKLKYSYETGDGESGMIVTLCDYCGSKYSGKNKDAIIHRSNDMTAQRQDRSHAVLSSMGVRGFIYYGHQDGMCAIPLNADELILGRYAVFQRGRADVPKNPKDIKWTEFNKQRGDINHIQYYMAKYGDEFIWDRNERGHCGTILVKSRKDGLYYFIDTQNDGKLLFDNGFYDARQFDDKTGMALVVVEKGLRPLFIDRNGDLFEKNGSKKPHSRLDFYTYVEPEDDIDFNNTDFDLSDFEL